MSNAIRTDNLIDKADRERRRKIMQQAKRRAAQSRPVTYASTKLVPEGFDRIEVHR